MKICVVCGKQFCAPPSSSKICCSKECSHIWRRRLIEAGVYKNSIRAANQIARTIPKLQRGEENINAKKWKIQAPDGKIYECYNLLDWLRRHADLLDGTPMQAWDGITKIKYSLQGKRKNPSYQWKGWKLLAWDNQRGNKNLAANSRELPRENCDRELE